MPGWPPKYWWRGHCRIFGTESRPVDETFILFADLAVPRICFERNFLQDIQGHIEKINA